MSDEKIDLAHMHDRAGFYLDAGNDDLCMFPEDVLALVRAVRAARTFIGSGHVADRMALDAALAPFTDSAESASGVRSDE